MLLFTLENFTGEILLEIFITTDALRLRNLNPDLTFFNAGGKDGQGLFWGDFG